MDGQQEKPRILLLEDESSLASLYQKVIEGEGFECVLVGTIAGFWQAFDKDFAAVIVDDSVGGGSFIDEGNGSNIMKIRELASWMLIGLNSSFPRGDMARRCNCVDLHKDFTEILRFLGQVQLVQSRLYSRQ